MATTSPNTVTHWHWVITLQLPRGGANYSMHTNSGTYGATADMTRQAIFEDLMDQIGRNLPAGAGAPNVLFWSLEPNTLDRD